MRWEPQSKRHARRAFWSKYRRAVRLEKNKALFKQRRRELEMLLEQGLLAEVPEDVSDIVLEYLDLAPTTKIPGGDRDERDYAHFKRRPRRGLSLFDEGPSMANIMMCLASLYMNTPGRG